MNHSHAPGDAGYAHYATMSNVAAALTAAIGVGVIAGWMLGVPVLKALVPGAIDMKPNAAFGLIFDALALYLLAGNAAPRRVLAGQLLAAAGAVLGFATLSQYVFDVNLGIDALVFGEGGGAAPGIGGRMSPYTAAGLACIGLGLACLPWRVMRPFVWIATAAVLLLGVVCVAGYAWRADGFILARPLPPMALNTAIAFVAIAIGTLAAMLRDTDGARPERPGPSPERNLLIGSAAALLVILVAAVFTWRTGADLQTSSSQLVRSQELRQAARHLYGSVASAQSAQRGYLLTREERLRTLYMRHLKEVAAYTRALTRLARPEHHAAVADIDRLSSRALDDLARQLTLFEREGEAAAKQAVSSMSGAELAQAIFDATERVANAEEAWLVANEADAARSRLLTLISLVLTMAVASGALLVLFRSIRGEIAARVHSELQVREAHRFCDSVIENIPDMVFVKDAAELRYVRVNRAAEEAIGRPRAELIGKVDRDLVPADVADELTRKDREALALGTVLDIPQERFVAASGEERILHTKKMPIFDGAGHARYVLGISQDVTERRRHEEKVLALNASLAQRAAEVEAANKELESFSYSVSHDLRAPLRHVSGYVQLLVEALDDKLEDEPRRFLRIISDASRQMGELIEDLLEFSRMTRTSMHEAPLDPGDIARDVIAGLELETRGRRIEWQVGPLPRVDGDPALVKQVFANLLGNAVKYTARRDTARIEVGEEGEEGGRAVLFVRDNGVGFDMKYAAKLFGIFQRLHSPEEFEGTGIGLATVQRIIGRHGGRVWAEAAPDAGATFYFTLKKAGGGSISA